MSETNEANAAKIVKSAVLASIACPDRESVFIASTLLGSLTEQSVLAGGCRVCAGRVKIS
jgi:hypothetical protein